MHYFDVPLGIGHYKRRSLAALTPSERDLYIDSPKQPITVEISAEDHEYIKKEGLNLSRITFFLIHDFLARKRPEWDATADGE